MDTTETDEAAEAAAPSSEEPLNLEESVATAVEENTQDDPVATVEEENCPTTEQSPQDESVATMVGEESWTFPEEFIEEHEVIECPAENEGEEEVIGIDREDLGASPTESLVTEIKEEEIEIDAEPLQSDENSEMGDPMGGVEMAQEDPEESTASDEQGSDIEKTKKGQLDIATNSETDTADEGLNTVEEHAYHKKTQPIKKAKKRVRFRKILPKPVGTFQQSEVSKKPVVQPGMLLPSGIFKKKLINQKGVYLPSGMPKKKLIHQIGIKLPKKPGRQSKAYLPSGNMPYPLPENVQGLLITRDSFHHCLECGNQFVSMIKYLKHLKNHPRMKNYPFSCSYCARKFQYQQDLYGHVIHHTKLESFTCPICMIRVYSSNGLAEHMRVHRIPDFHFKCKQCTVRFSSCKQLKAHTLAAHPTYNDANKNLSRTVHVCFHCGKVENSWDELLVHMRCHKEPMKCKICYLHLKDSDAFATHVSNYHKDRGELTYYRCTNASCFKEFISTKELKTHETTCLPTGGEYKCEICWQKYREIDHFISHMQLHAMLSRESQNSICVHCSYRGQSPAEYANHVVNMHGYRDKLDSIIQAWQVDCNADTSEEEPVEEPAEESEEESTMVQAEETIVLDDPDEFQTENIIELDDSEIEPDDSADEQHLKNTDDVIEMCK